MPSGRLSALALGGLPPHGRGVYIRDRAEVAAELRVHFAAVNAARSDAVQQAAATGGAWLYSTPDSWRPETWQAGLQRILQKRRQILAEGVDVHGIIADPEGGWPELGRARRESEAARMGDALAAIANDMRVGLTSYPMWGGREALVGAAGDALWYSPQLYGRTSQDPDIIRRWYELWTDVAGAQRCIPSIAGWRASELHSTPQGYRDYLSMIPAAGGAIAWLGTGDVPAHIREALASYEPGGSALGTAALTVRDFLFGSSGLALIVVGVAVLVVALAVRMRAGA